MHWKKPGPGSCSPLRSNWDSLPAPTFSTPTRPLLSWGRITGGGWVTPFSANLESEWKIVLVGVKTKGSTCTTPYNSLTKRNATQREGRAVPAGGGEGGLYASTEKSPTAFVRLRPIATYRVGITAHATYLPTLARAGVRSKKKQANEWWWMIEGIASTDGH